jgi:hypothetical protein
MGNGAAFVIRGTIPNISLSYYLTKKSLFIALWPDANASYKAAFQADLMEFSSKAAAQAFLNAYQMHNKTSITAFFIEDSPGPDFNRNPKPKKSSGGIGI